MKTLVLYYDKNFRLKVTDTLDDLKDLLPQPSVIYISNPLAVNNYLLKNDLEVVNPEVLEKELKLFRVHDVVGKSEKEINEIQLRQYLEDEVLK